jgi:hypothetical protein
MLGQVLRHVPDVGRNTMPGLILAHEINGNPMLFVQIQAFLAGQLERQLPVPVLGPEEISFLVSPCRNVARCHWNPLLAGAM